MKKSMFALGLTGAALFSACESTTVAREHVVLQDTYTAEGSRWPIECVGPLRSVEAKSGDILLRLVLNNTSLVQPANLGRPDVPQEVYLAAVADINQLPNPNEIKGGEFYELPERCQPQ